MDIEYVFVPPNSIYYPYTLLSYTDKSGFNQACPAELVLGKTHDEIKKLDNDDNNIASFKNTKSESKSYSLDLDSKIKAKLGAKYTDLDHFNISLRKGKKIEFYENLDSVIENIIKNCGANIRIAIKNNPEFKYFLPTSVFRYDIDFDLQTKNNTKITGELPYEVFQVISAKLGINSGNDNNQSLTGEHMFIGFNGIPMEATIEELILSNRAYIAALANILPHTCHNCADFTPFFSDEKPQPKLYDMTRILNKLLNPSNPDFDK
ncbi:hypothetical protein CEK71_17795 [Methylovulum psychrotolerans]|uniref:Uncharacterized protein n=2 Tax=Methylovulum psychrotolerans TaxID=1704499 RepID=A0A1Z4C2K7_9GAMM|nr:hypothetical protein CEK71_17795 [Methylovulum psychrotolerans]